ncbi:MAG: BrnT family toxin, partial [Scytonema sp. PMC 1069.18]|nr:BrnT family toxin [Scytonema sp. PMC 1069.18]
EKVSGFDWDDGNIDKCQKHGVSIEEIETLFFNPKVAIAPDIKHSEAEERFLAIGVSTSRRHIFVAFTFRKKQDEILIRPISARYMHEKEVQRYEENFT